MRTEASKKKAKARQCVHKKKKVSKMPEERVAILFSIYGSLIQGGNIDF